MEDSIKKIIQALRKFNDDRDWSQYHDPKNVALAISIEASELNEIFLWKKPSEVEIDKIKEELADVFLYSFLMADKCGLNVEQICMDKIKRNAEKYPIAKAKGTNLKYTEFTQI